MKIALASDHAGFGLKETLRDVLRGEGYAVLDLGAHNELPSDYPDFAELVGTAVLEGRAERGLLLCGSGVGASVAANKLRGIRAGLCHDTYSAHQGVERDDMSVLVLGARAVLAAAKNKSDPISRWANALAQRRGYWKAVVAIAAKNARMCWAVLSRGEDFRLPA